MRHSLHEISWLKRTAITMGASIGAASAMAANSAPAEAQLRYQQERTVCLSGQSSQDQATCLREANAAYAEAKRGLLNDGPVNYAANARKRCAPLPDEDRRDCEARMQGQGTTSGSVDEGGILRQLVTIEVGSPNTGSAARN